MLVTIHRPVGGVREVLVRVGSNDPVEAEQTVRLRFEVMP